MKRPLGAALLVTWLALALPDGARAQSALDSLGNGQDAGKPVNIEADQGIEWQQEHHVYIARGNVKATRGQSTLYCDTLYAFYRPSGKDAGAKNANGQPIPPKPDKPAAAASGTAAAPATGATGLLGDSSSEIYRLEADGNVRLATETQTVYGDHAIDDVDQAVMVMTGKHLKLVTPNDVVTARDSLEWYDHQQLAVARGDAVAVRNGKTIKGDVLTAYVERPANQPSHISHINATGHVIVSSIDQVGTGDTGVYNLDTGIATLTGHVSLTKGDNEMRGQYAVVDVNKNIGHLLSAPPDAVAGAKRPRVEGLLVPRQKAGAATPASATPAKTTPATLPAKTTPSPTKPTPPPAH
jgi:lipopolysaccharide export system protein LptA